jgi:hypothetical protein
MWLDVGGDKQGLDRISTPYQPIRSPREKDHTACSSLAAAQVRVRVRQACMSVASLLGRRHEDENRLVALANAVGRHEHVSRLAPQ